MKLLKLSIVILLGCAAIGLTAVIMINAQEARPPKASGEFILNTMRSADLNADFLRITGGEWTLDSAITNWQTSFRWEAWKASGDEKRIVSRGELSLTVLQLRDLITAPNPKRALATALLQDAVLTEKP